MDKKVRRIIFKVIAGIILLAGALLLVLYIPKLSGLDDLYNDSYDKCEKRENNEYEQQGHKEMVPYEYDGNTLFHYEKTVSDYEKKDCREEASRIKKEEESSLQFWVIIGVVTIAFGIITLFVSFI